VKAKSKTILLASLAALDCMFGAVIFGGFVNSNGKERIKDIKTSANYVVVKSINDVGEDVKAELEETDTTQETINIVNLANKTVTTQRAEYLKKVAAAKEAAAKKAAEQKKNAVKTTTTKGKTSGGVLTKSKGVVYFNGHRETYYSQKVLPGKGLKIPGRHVAADGTIRDKDNYICVAADPKYLAKGSIVETSLGMAKVYDCGCAYGTIDVYVNW
jgi:hypothetical protein